MPATHTPSHTPMQTVQHQFARLTAYWPQTAAAQVPLVLLHDVVHAGTEQAANCHSDFFSLYFVQQGRGTHWIEGVPYGVARGDVYAMGLGMTHWFADCEHLQTHTLHFSPDIFDAPTLNALAETPGFQPLFVEEPLRRGLAQSTREQSTREQSTREQSTREQSTREQSNGGRWLHLTPEAYAPVAEMLRELEQEWAAGTPDGMLLTRGLFLRLLVHLARRYAETPAPRLAVLESSSQEATVAAAVRWFDTHFAEPLRIEQVAASVFLSPDRFTEVFAQTMGRTPRDYVRHLRLERARVLLATTDLSIAAVGLESGFGEAAYFTRVFRAALGITPREFRRRK